MNKYLLFSPTDFRYSVNKLENYLSEEAFTKYKIKVEIALIDTLANYGICSYKIAREFKHIIDKISTNEVAKEESRIKHEVRALVNIIKKNVSDSAKPYVHITATSSDIVDSARALMYRDAIFRVILPDMIALERTWIDLGRRERNTVQIGRTHGQHAEPITFGFAIAQYVERWGNRIVSVKEAANRLVGKFSGSVGAYNASSLLLKNPERFERDLLSKLGLSPARISTQIIPPERTVDLIHSIISSFGVLANYADDMRHLQRTEIDEVNEYHKKAHIGSSSMPHKRNPIEVENVKSAWKEFMPRMITVYLDQISEHQRDLTNSLSNRYVPELFVLFDLSIDKIIKYSKRLFVNKINMKKNLSLGRDKIVAEPLQTLLSYSGHPDAFCKIKQLIDKSIKTGEPLIKIIEKDREIKLYLDKVGKDKIQIVHDTRKYVGIASKKVEKVCKYWETAINTLELDA